MRLFLFVTLNLFDLATGATINGEDFSSDVAGEIGGEVEESVGDVGWFTNAAERDGFDERINN